MKMGDFVCIKIHVLSITGPLGYYKTVFRGAHICSRISKKRKLRENMCSGKFLPSQSVYGKPPGLPVMDIYFRE